MPNHGAASMLGGFVVLKVAIVDDSLAIQRSLNRLLKSVAGVEIVGFAENVSMAQYVIDSTHPDVVLLDANLRDGEAGLDVVHHVALHHPATRVIVLSNLAVAETRQAYLDAGTMAYFDKATEFIQARDWIAARVAEAGAG
jgi:response regulator of citrate/malate metabolism